MPDRSRRVFLRSATVGAAAVGVAAAVPSASAAAASTPAHSGPFLVHVKDAASGEVSVLVGEREIVHHDQALARRLAAIAARAR